jgi:hypothetical protein
VSGESSLVVVFAHWEDGRKEQADMKRSLRQGGPADLNVYLNWYDPRPSCLTNLTFSSSSAWNLPVYLDTPHSQETSKKTR